MKSDLDGFLAENVEFDVEGFAIGDHILEE
jgi:hypothetical protein